jgi:predicted permease
VCNGRDWLAVGGGTTNYFLRTTTVFEGIAAYRYELLTMTGGSGPESMLGLQTTDRLFSVLGVDALIGRTFLPGEDAPERRHVAVISYGLWQRQFGGDPKVIGRSVTIDGDSHAIIGVMPSGFRFPSNVPGDANMAFSSDLWIPIRPGAPDLEDRGSHNYWAVGRLKSEVSLAQARLAMNRLASNLALQYPRSNKDIGVTVLPLDQYVGGTARPALLLLLAAVGAVLLLTCANISGLLLSRNDTRKREMGMRQALGASRSRLVRQTLTESLLLSLIGATVGVGVAQFGVRLLVRLAPANIPRVEQTTVDGTVLTFTTIVTLCVGLLFGLAPAFLGWRGNVHTMLKETAVRASEASSARRVRQALVAGQLAMAVMLLIAAGLLVRSFVRVTNLELGFRAPRVLTAFVNLSPLRYDTPERQAAFFEELIRRIQTMPGIEAAAVGRSVPLTGVNDQGGVQLEGVALPAGADAPNGNRPRVSTRYFEAMGIRLVEGRLFDSRDNEQSTPVAVVSELAARMYWPDGALGRRVAIERNAQGQPVWRDVIGVVESTRHFGLELPQKPEFYVPHVQAATPFMQLVVRTRTDPAAMIPAVQKAIAAIDPEQPIAGFQAMEDLLKGSRARRQFQMALVMAFATLALLLAAIGVYAAMSHMVAQRRREIGVRMAFGARPNDIIALVLRNGLGLTVTGTAAGLAGAAGVSQLLTHLLFEISPFDLATYLAVAAVLVSWRQSRRIFQAAVPDESIHSSS